MIHVEPSAKLYFAGERSVSDYMQIECDVVRRFKNRRTGRFLRNGRAFYIKAHGPLGWRDVLDDLIRFRKPQIGARPEWQAIKTLEGLGISTARVAVFGEVGMPSPWQQSFLITEEIADAISLETQLARPDCPRPGSLFRRRVVRAIASLARTLHSNGIVHRDFYLCHLLLDVSSGLDASKCVKPKLYLLDLHRAQKWSRVRRRWLIKDLGGLLFSALDPLPTPRELLLFARIYLRGPEQQSLALDARLWRDVQLRAERLYRREHTKRRRNAA